MHKDSEGVQKNRCGEAGDKGMSQVSLGLNRHCARPSSDFLCEMSVFWVLPEAAAMRKKCNSAYRVARPGQPDIW